MARQHIKGFVVRLNQGQITIPKDVRDQMRLEEGDYLQVLIRRLDTSAMSMHRVYSPARETHILPWQISAVKFAHEA